MKLSVYGIHAEIGHSPVLDPDFYPMHLFNEAPEDGNKAHRHCGGTCRW